ncbi:MAG TPA: DUF2975 domain-containing protein [Candidatus Eubacterium faecipullorum]|uniref:DUF2975 domain-containing protein n=1 Tax=Candidatus Eubacterium faecipullorum TaxID=2838571 RepID=A0A9D1UG39_9FIRM|nr:DUF2975 domain-containing protein [Candidatus Eubacterium faecipullorum]
MWNRERSVLLTQLIVRACYILLAAAVIALPFLFAQSQSPNEINMIADLGKYIIGPFYAIVPAGYTALICIDKLLSNIKKDIVFDPKNVKFLRIISWSCFFAAAVCLLAFVIITLSSDYTVGLGLLLITAGAVFMGLILRVIKNVFEAAIKIKTENDLTI